MDWLQSMTRVRRSQAEARAAYDRLSAWYDWLVGSSEEEHIGAGLENLDARPGEDILEVGFGTGDALVSLERSAGAGGGVYGVDISMGMARKAAAKLREAGERERAGVVCGDGARLPLTDHIADGLFMSFTLELFDRPRIPAVLSECRRVLRDSGRLSVVSLTKTDQRALPVRLYEWLHRRIPQYVDSRPIPVEDVLVHAGFEIKHVDHRTMWGLPVKVVLARVSVSAPYP